MQNMQINNRLYQEVGQPTTFSASATHDEPVVDNPSLTEMGKAGQVLKSTALSMPHTPNAAQFKEDKDNYETASGVVIAEAKKAVETLSGTSTHLAESQGEVINTALQDLPRTAQTNFVVTNSTDDKTLGETFVDVVDRMEKDYVNRWGDSMQAKTKFFERISALKTLIAQGVSSNDKNMDVKLEAVRKELNAILDDYGGALGLGYHTTPKYPLFETTNKQEALDWAAEIGLTKDQVIESIHKPGSYFVIPDISQLTDIRGRMISDGLKNPADFNNWQNGFDAHMTTIQGSLQTSAERYNRAIAIFDKMASILTSILNSDGETKKTIAGAFA